MNKNYSLLGRIILIAIVPFSMILSACAGDLSPRYETSPIIPNSNSTWYLQLQGDVNLDVNVDLYEVDLFDTSTADISYLKSRGITVICYFSAGSYENWREDADAFADQDLGKALDGWPGESWLDITSDNVRKIMAKRIRLAAAKGCDGVDPDNVDGYTNPTGFPLTASDQLKYNKFLARKAHKRGLIIGLKNDVDQIAKLEPFFDFAINEQCLYYQECARTTPFKESNKLIINLEYDTSFIAGNSQKSVLCSKADSFGMMTQVQTYDLDGSILYSCF